jgi:hypothetical protein
MALLQEIWVNDITQKLYESNAFLQHSTDHSAFAHGTLVHVPQAGPLPASQKNRVTLPGAIIQRADADLTYPVYSRSTDPVLVPDLEAYQLSYDKRQSVMAHHIDRLLEDTGRDVAYEWAPTLAPRIVKTSGTATATNLPPAATGTRKAVTLADIAALARMFDLDLVPEQERYLMLHPALYYELFNTEALLRVDMMGRATLPSGVITSLFGFNIIVRGLTPLYTGATPAPKQGSDPAAAADSFAGIAWQKSCVARAISTIEVFENQKDATYYGDVLSARIFCGAAKIRSGQTGCAALVQG